MVYYEETVVTYMNSKNTKGLMEKNNKVYWRIINVYEHSNKECIEIFSVICFVYIIL